MAEYKIFIAIEMKGYAGILSSKDWSLSKSRYYNKGKFLFTPKVNTATAGFFEIISNFEITVVEGHGHADLPLELLNERAFLQRYWLAGRQDEYCGVYVVIGQHPKNNMDDSPIPPKDSFYNIDMSLNNTSEDEHDSALVAWNLNIPTIFESDEGTFYWEAKAITPEDRTVLSKRGSLKYPELVLRTEQYWSAQIIYDTLFSIGNVTPNQCWRSKRLPRQKTSFAVSRNNAA